ncbi:glycosyltransferase [Thioalkalivibrio sp. ALMg9]|uniref:glycosyltransferase n=1 Tax=Thioalkalivibrio sp. ALMg9 TaxID=1266912 RepID=UPI00036E9E67|nr:glycosyltransferase [Thioalkalivibrio sp. ALMg9]
MTDSAANAAKQPPPLAGRHITYVVENGDQVAEDVRQQMRAVRRLGAFVTACCLCGAGQALTPNQDYDHLSLLGMEVRQLSGSRIHAIRRFRNHLRQDTSDTLICDQYKSITTAVLATAIPGTGRRRIIALIRGFHAARSRTRRRFYRLFSRRIDAFITLTNAHKHHIHTMMPWFPLARFHVIPVYLDAEALRAQMVPAADARDALGIGAGPFTFGTVTRFDACKRLTDLVAASAILRDQGYDFRVVIVGDGREREALEVQIARAQLADHVLLTGVVPAAARYFKAFDTFVFPSEGDSFGRVLLEARAAELPIIAADCGGPPEVIGSHGMIARHRDPMDLASKMAAMLETPLPKRKDAAREGARWSRATYTVEALTAELHQVLEKRGPD